MLSLSPSFLQMVFHFAFGYQRFRLCISEIWGDLTIGRGIVWVGSVWISAKDLIENINELPRLYFVYKVDLCTAADRFPYFFPVYWPNDSSHYNEGHDYSAISSDAPMKLPYLLSSRKLIDYRKACIKLQQGQLIHTNENHAILEARQKRIQRG